MKTMNSKRIAVVLTLAAIFAAGGTLRAQSAITIAGGDFKNPSGSVSYSCGEVAVKVAEQKAFTVVNITESFNEGVQQPFTPRDAGNNSISPLAVKLEVYPNPATDCVNIEGEGAGRPATAKRQIRRREGAYRPEHLRVGQLPAAHCLAGQHTSQHI